MTPPRLLSGAEQARGRLIAQLFNRAALHDEFKCDGYGVRITQPLTGAIDARLEMWRPASPNISEYMTAPTAAVELACAQITVVDGQLARAIVETPKPTPPPALPVSLEARAAAPQQAKTATREDVMPTGQYDRSKAKPRAAATKKPPLAKRPYKRSSDNAAEQKPPAGEDRHTPIAPAATAAGGRSLTITTAYPFAAERSRIAAERLSLDHQEQLLDRIEGVAR